MVIYRSYKESVLAVVTDEKIQEVAHKLWMNVYEDEFRGKERGRFCLTRRQLMDALDTTRLHASTIQRLQDEALRVGLIVVDLDDLFPCVEVKVLRKYRRPPAEVFLRHFPKPSEEQDGEAEEDD
jgi:hypothetical protein